MSTIQVVKKKDKLQVVLQRGTKGYRGWTYVLANVVDGSRRVQQVIDWVGGEGTKPATGQYVGTTGLVTNIADATDMRGAAGADGVTVIMTRSSTSSVAIATGSKTFAYSAATNLGWTTGMRLRVSYDSANYLEGVITAVSSTSVTISADLAVGSGTRTTWTLGLAGDKGNPGADGTNSVMTRSSTSSIAIATGSKTFAYTSASNLGWVVGMRLRVSYDTSNYIEGVITAVSSTSVTISADLTAGSGTYTAWSIGVAGDRGVSIPTGGTAGQILAKNSSTNYDFGWADFISVPTATTATSQTLTFVTKRVVHHEHTTTSSTTFSFSGASAGSELRLVVTIGSSGHTLSFSGVTSWPGGTATAPSFSTASGAIYAIAFMCKGTNVHCIGFTPL